MDVRETLIVNVHWLPLPSGARSLYSSKNPRNEGFRGPIAGVSATGESGLSIRVIAIEVANK